MIKAPTVRMRVKRPIGLGHCPICAQPLDRTQQTLFHDQFHEACLPECADCHKPLKAMTCELIWRGKAEWFGRHKVPYPSIR